MRATWLALASGVVFGVGLVLSGMTDPGNVVRFLDVTGNWKPDLALVMGGAIAVHATILQWSRRRRAVPGVAAAVTDGAVPTKRVDASLVVGAAVFGIGWGLSGYCPAPAIVAVGFGSAGAAVFVLASVAGILLANLQAASPPLDVPESLRRPPADGVLSP